MASTAFTGLPSLSAPAGGDVLACVDISDTTDGLSGTSKQVTASDLIGSVGVPVFNVKAYGAVGDGATNDTTAIQAAITAASVAGGGRVLIPAGVFNHTGLSITSDGVTLCGVGRIASTLFSSGIGASTPSLTIDGSGSGLIEGVSVEDLGFDSSYSGLGHIKVQNAVRWNLSRLYLQRCNAQISVGVYTGGVYTTQSYVGTLEDVYTDHIGGHGFLIGPTTNAVVMVGCRAHSCSGDGIRFDGSPVAGFGIVGSVFEGNAGYGLHVSPTAGLQALDIGAGTYFEQNHFGDTPGPEILLATPTTGGATDGFILDGCLIDGGSVNTYPVRVEAVTNGRIGKNHYMRCITANKPQIVGSAYIQALDVDWPDRGNMRQSHGVGLAQGVRSHSNSSSGGEEWEYGAGIPLVTEAGFHWNNRTLSQVTARLDSKTWAAASHPIFGLGASGPAFHFGTNSPESVVTGNVGDVFLRTNGGANTTLYIKESGTGNTGWIGK